MVAFVLALKRSCFREWHLVAEQACWASQVVELVQVVQVAEIFEVAEVVSQAWWDGREVGEGKEVVESVEAGVVIGDRSWKPRKAVL